MSFVPRGLIEGRSRLDTNSQEPASTPPPATPARLSRRTWLKRIAMTGAVSAGAVGLYTWQLEPHWVEVVRRDLPIRGLPSELEGKSLVQVTDIHIGDRVDDDFLIAWFREIASWKPDYVVFTGDFLTLFRDGSVPIEKMERILSHFPKGRLGTAGVLGNHDYGMNWREPKVADLTVSIAKNSGLPILRNATTELSGLQIVGFDDFWTPNFGGKNVLAKVDHSRPTIVLCHNPDVADLPIWWNYQGWILSGHTHGGQCKAPFLPPPLLPVVNRKYSSGEFLLADGRHLYINRALGHSMRVRFNVRPEITLFRMTRDQSEQVPT